MILIRPIHPFPARMAPDIVLNEISKFKNKIVVLDPMVGSGTTLVTSRTLGHKVIGYDRDPLAVTIAKAWTSDIKDEEILLNANEVLEKSRVRFHDLKSEKAYPAYADEETREFIRYWFDIINRKQLTLLANEIHKISSDSVRMVLWSAFSRLIITKKVGVSLAMDVSHSRPHKTYEVAPIKAFDSFLKSINYVLRNIPLSKKNCPKSMIKIGDARRLPIDNESIDLVITSPPYLNAIDYFRGHKLSLVWMGYTVKQIRDLRATNVGTESSRGFNTNSNEEKIVQKIGNIDHLPDRDINILNQYIFDLRKIMSEIKRVLSTKGRAILVVGNSTLKGTFIQNSKAVELISKELDFEVTKIKTRLLPQNRRYLPPPNSKRSGILLQKRMREEVVISLAK